MGNPVLQLREVHKGYVVKKRDGADGGKSNQTLDAVGGISLAVQQGMSVGIVGESGSGKSTLLRCIMQIERPDGGQVIFKGRDMSAVPDKRLNQYYRSVQWVPQDPYASLDPRMSVERIVGEPLAVLGENRRVRATKVGDALDAVGLGGRILKAYPHELSGGERQRVSIARALSVSPTMLMLDEPVSALDVSVRAEVLNLLMTFQDEMQLSYLMVGHDLAVILGVCQRVAVMYAGRVIEVAGADELYRWPKHPYTKALFSAVPIPDPEREESRERIVLGGEPAYPIKGERGCRFRARCPVYGSLLSEEEQELCNTHDPALEADTDCPTDEHYVACHYVGRSERNRNAPGWSLRGGPVAH